MKILVLGASGLLGHAIFTELVDYGLDVYGSVRDSEKFKDILPAEYFKRLVDGVNANDFSTIEKAALKLWPDVIINCIGLIRQKEEGREALPCIEINARFPHLLFSLSRGMRCRLIHYSTDCVFDGKKGAPYVEGDYCSAKDVYGISKFLGEVTFPRALTLRTSVIGHELFGETNGLLEWFLSQEGEVAGFVRAIFSGLPAVEHARILYKHILPSGLHGLYQLASSPISKYDLLRLMAKVYGKETLIQPNDFIVEDKTLSGEKFFQFTDYVAPPWPDLMTSQYNSYLAHKRLYHV
ncbi:MAG: SDR family oxidoreductase [Deltaproteobacteria bacterium]|jgi:dTDP-4-dehydrorhamnose reductase|nr:SDR family oxidoreductase [Deltaproteobacteria bacterium]